MQRALKASCLSWARCRSNTPITPSGKSGYWAVRATRKARLPARLPSGNNELNLQANRLAHLLISKGIGPETLVALALPRSIEMVTGLLAILKTGAAYLPLDPDYPTERLAYMLQDAQPACVITTTKLSAH